MCATFAVFFMWNYEDMDVSAKEWHQGVIPFPFRLRAVRLWRQYQRLAAKILAESSNERPQAATDRIV